jgi:pimeloyl-ACP methyl ester carboxylesterase
LLGILVLLLIYTFKSFTTPILESGSIARLTSIEVNGDRQYLLIRGRDRENPVLLFVHGGPGMPAMFLAHSFQRELERDFVVVHWDQRAAGKSFRTGIDPASISTSQYLDDLFVVVNQLRDEFGQERIYLLGHSHGSYLGSLAVFQKPELFRAYIGVGQVVDEERAFAYQKAELAKKGAEIGLGVETVLSRANIEEFVFRAGGGLYCCQSFVPLLLTGLMAPEYSLMEAYNVKRGSSFSSRHMRFDVIPGAVDEAIKELRVPVYMISGKYDLTTPTAMSREFLEELVAPRKGFYEIEEASHFPFYEQPGRFAAVMVRIKAETDKPN